MLQSTKFVTMIIDLNMTDPINCKNLLYPTNKIYTVPHALLFKLYYFYV